MIVEAKVIICITLFVSIIVLRLDSASCLTQVCVRSAVTTTTAQLQQQSLQVTGIHLDRVYPPAFAVVLKKALLQQTATLCV